MSGPTPYRASRPGARAVTSGMISSSRRSSWPPGELRASSQLAQRDPGGVAGSAAGAGPQRCGLCHQGGYGVAGEPDPQVVGPGHDQGPGLVDGLGPLGAGAALGHHQRPDRLHRAERTQTINQARALVLTGPDDLRTRFAGHTAAALVAGIASLRPRPGDVPGYATRIALRELGRRAEFLDGQLERLDELIIPLVAARAPGLLALYGVGPDTAALLLVAAGDHPERLRSESAWAHLCAVAPIPASSGKVTRHRLNPGGDRQANHALWRIVLTRMSAHPPTRVYVGRRTKEGLSKNEIIRCLKRYVAREVYSHLRAAG